MSLLTAKLSRCEMEDLRESLLDRGYTYTGSVKLTSKQFNITPMVNGKFFVQFHQPPVDIFGEPEGPKASWPSTHRVDHRVRS